MDKPASFDINSGRDSLVSPDDVAFTYHGNFMGKPRQTRTDKWKKRPEVVRYRSWATEMKYMANVAGYELPATLSCIFYIEMPKSWSKKKTLEYYGSYHEAKPDLDNIIKGVQDILAKNDSYVYRYKDIYKVWWPYNKIEFLR